MSESTSQAAAAEKKAAPGHGAPHGHEHHGEDQYPYVAHHFDSPAQQLDAGKLGIWLFLVTEILFFAGLFCAYTIYRARYPEVFYWAHFFLDTKWGAVNTIVLILSSLTAAWAVRNAQLGQQKLLVINIVVTIACACTFMGVKYVEYSHKAHAGLLPGPAFAPHENLWENAEFKAKHPEAARAMERLLVDLEAHRVKLKAAEVEQQAAAAAAPATTQTQAAAAGDAPAPAEDAPAPAEEASDAPAEQGAGTGAPVEAQAEAKEPAAPMAQSEPAAQSQPAEPAVAAAEEVAEAAPQRKAAGEEAREAALPGHGSEGAESSMTAPGKPVPAAGAPGVPAGTLSVAAPVKRPVSEEIFIATAIRRLSDKERKPLVDAGIVKRHPTEGPQLERPTRAHMFFSIYFFMTGLHGLHVLIGIIVWVWLLLRALKGQFGPLYFGPIDFAALYWHLVDLIWIYLFPLLYLIH